MQGPARLVIPLIGGLLAFAIGVIVIHPFVTAPLSFDTAASVAYFQRIVSGRHLEAFVTTTPKPLLTVVYGLAYGISGEWRAISWVALVVMAAGVATAVALAQRTAGLVAGVFCAVVLAGAPSMVLDTSLAGGVGWAFLLLAVAGLAMTQTPPRPAIAGALLMLATLARLEVLVVTAVALSCLAMLELLSRLGRANPVPAASWLLLLGFMALPVMLLHDWLLTGDPMFWTQPSAATSITSPDAVMTPREVVRFLLARYEAVWPLAGLALVGGTALLLRRRWLVAIGVAALAMGIAAFLVALAVRGIYVSARYPELIDLTVAFSASIGFAAIVEVANAARKAVDQRGRLAAKVFIGAAVAISLPAAVLASNGWGPWDQALVAQVASGRTLIEDFDRVRPTLAGLTAPILTPADRALPGDYRFRASLPPPRLAVPVLARPYAAVVLNLPLWAVGAPPDLRDPATAFVRSAMVVFHDRAVDRRANRPQGYYAPYETIVPVRIGKVTLTPIYVDPGAGLYVDLLTPLG